MKHNTITCPQCHFEFDVESVIAGKIEAHFKAEYDKKLSAQQRQFAATEEKLAASQKNLDQAKKALQAEQAEYEARIKVDTDIAVKKALKAELAKAQKTIEASVAEDFEAELSALKAENAKRKADNKALKAQEVALLARENALREQQEELKLQVDKQVLERQKIIEEKAREKERQAFELERVKLLKQIEDNKNLAEEMRRKAEQGSTQLQGEVQELALESLLSNAYPFDAIEPVPKGIRGADSIQRVRNASQQHCGAIVYESKRTKNFGGDWIEKLKNDQVACKADIAVLVTQTLPDGITQFGERDGVWICDFHTVKSLSFILRDMLIRTHSVRQSQENKGEKMEMLYNYLTSNEFVQHVQRIVENYNAMQQQINDERKAMERLWKKREKQIEVVQLNLMGMFGSIEGYTGKTLSDSDSLGLPK